MSATYTQITAENAITAMCLWEHITELLMKADPAAVALVERAGTPEARQVVLSWVTECETEWEAVRADGSDHPCYDWEHCPAFADRKLAALLAEASEPEPSDPLDDWNYVGSRHHY